MNAYKTQAADTSIEAEKIQFELMRRLPIERRALQVLSFHRQAHDLRSDHSTSNPMPETPFELAVLIGTIFDRLELPYFISGGLASAILGERRTTEDVDIAVARLNVENARSLIAELSEFYVSETTVEEALQGQTSTFNIIHLTSAIKADIYPIRDNDEYRQNAIARRKKLDLGNGMEFYIGTPEDIVLQKLVWYGIAGNESAKQWRDILGILKLQKEALDLEYLWQWAEILDVLEELDRAFTEAGL